MARKVNPENFPSNPTLWGFNSYKLPEFMRLKVVLKGFIALLMNEKFEGRPPKPPLHPSADFHVQIWLSAGINEDAVDLDTAAFGAATIIREKYLPPVLARTADSLKPQMVVLASKIDNWMAEGMRWLFFNAEFPSMNAGGEWMFAGEVLMRELDRIWAASGGVMPSESAASDLPSADSRSMPPPLPPLNDTNTAIAKFITDHPGCKHTEILPKVSREHFSKDVFPHLRSHGFFRKGHRYFPPEKSVG